MHAFLPPDMPPPIKRPRREAGFSLVEVAMAIGIIAVCFVTLIALIPSGMGELRKAMDSNNDTRIVQSLVSLALASEYNHLKDLDEPIYYFDDEGSPLDTSSKPVADMRSKRIYAAKTFVQPGRVSSSPDLTLSAASRMTVVWGNIFQIDETVLTALTAQQVETLLQNPAPGRRFSVRSVTIAKTDGR